MPCPYCCTCYTTSCVYAYIRYQCAYVCRRIRVYVSVCMCAYTRGRSRLKMIAREEQNCLVFVLMHTVGSKSYKHVLIVFFSLLLSLVHNLSISLLHPPLFCPTTLHLVLSFHFSVFLSLNLTLNSRLRCPPLSQLQDLLWSLPAHSHHFLELPNR